MSDERRERYAARMAGFLGHIPEDGPIPDVFLATADVVMALADEEMALLRRELDILRDAEYRESDRLREENKRLRAEVLREGAAKLAEMMHGEPDGTYAAGLYAGETALRNMAEEGGS